MTLPLQANRIAESFRLEKVFKFIVCLYKVASKKKEKRNKLLYFSRIGINMVVSQNKI